MKAQLTLFFALLLVCLGTGAVLAQTPDGETPAEETVCDDETGAAFGLCNAYCEAMDCDSDDPQASENACSKVGSKFQQITGRDLPCEAAACPCLAEPAFVDVLTNASTCTDFGSGVVLGYIIEEGLSTEFRAEAVSAPDPTCNWASRGPRAGEPGSLSITPEEATACIQAMRDRAAELGLTCN